MCLIALKYEQQQQSWVVIPFPAAFFWISSSHFFHLCIWVKKKEQYQQPAEEATRVPQFINCNSAGLCHKQLN